MPHVLNDLCHFSYEKLLRKTILDTSVLEIWPCACERVFLPLSCLRRIESRA